MSIKDRILDTSAMQPAKGGIASHDKTKDANDSELNALDQTEKVSVSAFDGANEPSDRIKQPLNQDLTATNKVFKYKRQKLRGETIAEEQEMPSARNNIQESSIIRSRVSSY